MEMLKILSEKDHISNRNYTANKELQIAGIPFFKNTQPRPTLPIHVQGIIFITGGNLITIQRLSSSCLIEGPTPLKVPADLQKITPDGSVIVGEDDRQYRDEATGTMCIDSFRVTTQRALNIFVRTLKHYGLYLPTQPWLTIVECHDHHSFICTEYDLHVDPSKPKNHGIRANCPQCNRQVRIRRIPSKIKELLLYPPETS